MKYENAAFEICAGQLDQLPESSIPEIVFSGRSNVGKSSLINKIINRKSLARVSATPGKTGTINFYRLPGCRLVDLPGYGYAKVSQSEKLRWAELVEGYLSAGRKISLLIQIIDMRHNPTDDDVHMIDYLSQSGCPFIIAATKSDKLNKTQYIAQLNALQEYFPRFCILPVSALKGTGVEALREEIETVCASNIEKE